MQNNILDFLLRLYRFNPRKIILSFVLTILLSLFEGISIVAILPVLSLTGLYSNGNSNSLVRLLNNLGTHHLTLSLALIIFIMLIAVSAILQRQQSLLTANIQQKFNTHLTTNLYRILANTSWSYWLGKTKSDINHVISNEISRVTIGCYFLFQLVGAAFILLIYLILSICIAPFLTLLIFLGGGILFIILSSLVKKSRYAGAAISQYSRELFFGISEHLNGIKEVKAYGLENFHLKQLNNLRNKVENNYLKFNQTQAKLDMIYKIVAALFISVVFYVAIEFLHLGIESLLLIIIIFARIWPRISSLQNSLHSIAVALPAFNTIQTLEQEALNEQQITQQVTQQIKHLETITVKNLSFRFASQSQATLHDISFDIKHGEFIACVGHSGSGKSTLSDLLLGLLSPTEGYIMVNQIPLTAIKESWQQLVSYVPQDIFLFNASIRENLCWSAPLASEDEIWEMLKIVQLYQLIKQLPNQLDSLVGDRGINLSGGERQRLVLARALLRKPQLLILDEATSALDEQNERLIQHALEQLKGKLTVFVIAHRLSTIAQADKIITLKAGSAEITSCK